jgi:hypothetical protein
VETTTKQCRKSGKVIREYSLQINENNTFWDNIVNFNIDYNENLIKL